MKDVTEVSKKIISTNSDWTFSTFYFTVEVLKNSGVNLSFWEGEENWVSLIVGQKTAGFVWKKYPLVVFEKNHLPHLEMYLKEIELIFYIEVECLSKDLFKINSKGLEVYFEGFTNFNSFTMDDLWFQTNSI